ncbi:MAG: 2OG-Fe(II) oxygenase, partial [Planctomycetota bacterium]
MPEYNYLSEEVFTVTDFFTHEECDSHIEFSESMGFDDAPINTALGPVIRKDVRNNTRVIHDDQRSAKDLWSRIPDYIPHRIADWH